ncbi:TyrR/PhhR family helix-turn-helix DNA-binding protein [Azotobacter chroococcum]
MLQRLLGEYPSSRLLARRLGVSHTTIANKLRQHGLRCTPDEGPSGKG